MKKILIYILLLFFIGVLSGCGFKDIDKRSFVVSIGIDQPESKEMKYKVILKIAIPQADIKKEEEAFIIMTEETDSISEAIRLMKGKIDKELDFGHAKAILFGEGFVKNEERLDRTMDWFMRRRDIQKIAWIGIGSPTAKEILELKPKSERIPSNSIFLSFGQTGTESSYTVSRFLFELYRSIQNDGVDATLPLLELNKETTIPEINKVVVFKGKKSHITLSEDETKTFNVVSDKFPKVNIKVEEDNEFFILNVDSIKTSYTIHTPSNTKPFIDFNVEFEGIIEESKNPLNTEELEKYQKLAQKVSRKRIESLLEKLQEENVDPFGFGMRYRATRINEFDKIEKWREIYPSIEFNVNVQTKVKGTGIIE